MGTRSEPKAVKHGKNSHTNSKKGHDWPLGKVGIFPAFLVLTASLNDAYRVIFLLVPPPKFLSVEDAIIPTKKLKWTYQTTHAKVFLFFGTDPAQGGAGPVKKTTL